ncbi:hypothetical protein [Kineobactrum sediminis]|uniref:hypothetical protein n=1 Tax=Kineobactrum sediminis TaxID=1905677 RepID=UPI001F4DC5E4|nr:hypothetical protein [Kineobactrum sediminis]
MKAPWHAAVFNKRILTCVFTGLASGMPLYVLLQLVPAWLRDQGVSLTEIGLFALVVGFMFLYKIGDNMAFLLCAVIALPGMLLLFWVAPWREGEA